MREWRKKNKERILPLERARQKKWRSANKDKVSAMKKSYHKRYPEKSRAELLVRYKLTPEEYERMKSTQNGRCAICKNISKKNLSVDHDHTTGKVRGLLCGRCNTMLGMACDSELVLESAIKYLHGDSWGL